MSNDIEVIGDTLTITRTFDAPRDVVFDAFTDPEKVKKWSGCPDGATLKVAMDFRVGGECRSIVEMNGDTVLTSIATYTEIDVPRRLAYRLNWEPFQVPETLITVDFTEHGTKTEVFLMQSGLSGDDMKDAVQEGWGSAFDKLAGAVEGTRQDA